VSVSVRGRVLWRGEARRVGDRVARVRAPATSRRAAVGIVCGGAAALAGCSLDLDGDPDDPAANPSSTGSTGPTAAPDDPDTAAVDAAVATTEELLGLLAAGGPALDPGGLLAGMHAAHLAVLTDGQPSASPSPTTDTHGADVRRQVARLRRRELAAEREFAQLGVAASSGALARLLASMSAGVAAHLAATTAREPR
jgi:hypothetical protein